MALGLVEMLRWLKSKLLSRAANELRSSEFAQNSGFSFSIYYRLMSEF